MARSDLLLTLGRAAMAGDTALLCATVEALAAELVLTDVIRHQVANPFEEQHRQDLRRSHGLQRHHRRLPSGLPSGKAAPLPSS
jgi:hypothetical protein